MRAWGLHLKVAPIQPKVNFVIFLEKIFFVFFGRISIAEYVYFICRGGFCPEVWNLFHCFKVGSCFVLSNSLATPFPNIGIHCPP